MSTATEFLITDATGKEIVEAIKNSGGGGTPNAVQYVPQTLTDAQKEQARVNIDAASATEQTELKENLTQLSGTIGINLFDSQHVTSGWLNQSGDVEPTNNYYVSYYIEVLPSTQYYISATGSARLKFYDSNKKALTNAWDGTGGSAGVFTTNESTAYVRFTISINNDINAVILNISNPSINGTYYPFRGLRRDIAENLTHQAELLVDGYMTPVFGTVHNSSDGQTYTKRIGRVDLGSMDWRYDAGLNIFSDSTFVTKTNGSDFLCDGYSNSGYTIVANMPNMSIQLRTNVIYLRNTSYTTSESFKQAMQGKYLYYELATPETYDLVNYVSHKGIRSPISIKSYTTTAYVCPNDGYVYVVNRSGQKGYALLFNDNIALGGNEGYFCLNVYKGTTVKIVGDVQAASFAAAI